MTFSIVGPIVQLGIGRDLIQQQIMLGQLQ